MAVVELLPQALPTVHDTVYVPVAVVELGGAVTLTEVALVPGAVVKEPLLRDQLYVLAPVGPVTV